MKRYLTKRRVLEWCAAQTKGVTDMKTFSLVIKADTAQEVKDAIEYAAIWAERHVAYVNSMPVDGEHTLIVSPKAGELLTLNRSE